MVTPLKKNLIDFVHPDSAGKKPEPKFIVFGEITVLVRSEFIKQAFAQKNRGMSKRTFDKAVK